MQIALFTCSWKLNIRRINYPSSSSVYRPRTLYRYIGSVGILHLGFCSLYHDANDFNILGIFSADAPSHISMPHLVVGMGMCDLAACCSCSFAVIAQIREMRISKRSTNSISWPWEYHILHQCFLFQTFIVRNVFHIASTIFPRPHNVPHGPIRSSGPAILAITWNQPVFCVTRNLHEGTYSSLDSIGPNMVPRTVELHPSSH